MLLTMRPTVLFIEAKDSGASAKMIEMLTARGFKDRTVIKMYRNGSGKFDPNSGYLKYVRERGFRTWCYFDAPDPMENIAQLVASSNVDLIGVPFFEFVVGRNPTSMSDEQIAAVVAMGKPVIVWEVHRRSVRDRFAAMGVRGFMSPNPYWLSGGGGH